jgi:type I restriction enzyme S subunit
MEEWKIYKLGEITSKIGSGATPKGGRDSYLGGNISLIRSQNVLDFSFSKSGLAYINEMQAEKLNNVEVYEKDVLLNITGDSVARVCIVPNNVLPARVNQHVAIIRGNEKVDYRYLLYYLQYIKPQLLSLSQGGATRNALTKKMIEELEIKMPSKGTQKEIVSILYTLDTKIALNRRINDNLEQQAQTLFKSWLVDFDPFKNGKFVESEMGMIPEGWKVISLQEYCQEITRGNIPTYVEKSNRPILNQKVNKGVSLEKQYYKYNSENVEVSISKMAHYGDVLLNSLGQGTLGRVHLYKEKLGNVIIDQFITILRTNLFVKSAYLSYTLNRPEYQTIIEGNVTGSTGMWVLTINNVRNIKIIVPKESCFLELAPIINSIYQAISNNTAEMEQLCTLRDCILPHLMSGELKINDLNC